MKGMSIMSLNDVLKQMGASNRGDYFMMYCPKCGKKEAFCYIDDINKWNKDHSHRIPIRCNRLNKCGEVSYLNDFLEGKVAQEEIKIKERNPVKMSKEGVELLQSYCRYVTHTLHGNTHGFDFDLRGISNETMKKHGIIYNQKTFQSLLNQENTKKYFGDKYRHKSYEDRDIIIPILNKEGIPERLLLRSSYRKEDNYKKEIQVMLVRRGVEIWNLQDLFGDNSTVFVTEGVYDALSIKEVCPEASVIALPGVGKYKQLLRIMKKEDIVKNVVFCFDDDEAGQESIEKAKTAFKKENIPVYSLSVEGDCNEMLQKNRKELEMEVKSAMLRIAKKSKE